jgi:hypothetical protein
MVRDHNVGRRRFVRRIIQIASVAALLAALSATTVALATSVGRTTKTVSATFAAGTVRHLTMTSCTGADGVYAVTNARYDGTATSADPRLNGQLRIQVRSVVNTTTNLGFVRGTFRVRNTAGGSSDGSLVGVLSGGTLQGFVTGDLRRSGGTDLLGSVTASFTAASGFTGGLLGTGTAMDTAIAVTGACSHSGG